MQKKTVLIFVIMICMLSFSGRQIPQITVVAAANTQFVIKKITKSFTKKTGIQVQLIFGSSGKLAMQIKNGAPFDVFLSADQKFPEYLEKEGLTEYPSEIYAEGELVIWLAKKTHQPASLRTLLNTDIRTIAIANPKTAPYGQKAINILKQTQLYQKISDKLVYGGSISQVNQYIFNQTVDAALTAKSTFFSGDFPTDANWIALDKNTYQPIKQAAVLLKHGKIHHPKAAEAFYQNLFSESAKAIFKAHGYKVHE